MEAAHDVQSPGEGRLEIAMILIHQTHPSMATLVEAFESKLKM
jgi:hypothetical protein